MGVTVFWDKPTASSVFGTPSQHKQKKTLKKTVQLDALRGTGMVNGATYTVGVLSRSYAALLQFERVMVNIQDLYQPGELGVDHIKQSVRDLNASGKVARFLQGANAFKKEFTKYAAIISCHPRYFARFLLNGAGEIATDIGGQLGEEQGVPIEAAFSVQKNRKHILESNS